MKSNLFNEAKTLMAKPLSEDPNADKAIKGEKKLCLIKVSPASD